MDNAHLPTARLTAALPDINAIFKATPDDFVVEEIPAYEPSGEGEHVYIWLQKSDVAHKQLLKLLEETYGASARDIGTAGIKDRVATTRQWISIHDPAGGIDPTPGEIAEGVEVLRATRHLNKLRTGHLRGNRFELLLTEVEEPQDEAIQRVTAILEVLNAEGVPNFFGDQRFGRGDSTLELGRAVLRGERPPQLRRNKWLAKLAASAAQSAVFNAVTNRRLDEGTHARALLGDRLNRVAERGQLVVTAENQAEAQAEIDGGRLVVTGPMPGPKMYDTYEEVAELEREAIEGLGMTPEQFVKLGKRAPGTRRDLMFRFVDPPWVEWRAPDALAIGFSLPSGSYATVLLRELLSSELPASETS